jgi:predicted ABC-type ATPase
MQKQKTLWDSGLRAHKEIKKLAFTYVDETFDMLVSEVLKTKSDFVYEGHFTNEATWNIPRQFKAAGYTIHMFFFGLKDTNLSELRVIDRSKEGGHYVDPDTIASNFYGNLEKLNKHFAMFDHLEIIDSSGVEHKVLCIITNGEIADAVSIGDLPQWFVQYLPGIAIKIT